MRPRKTYLAAKDIVKYFLGDDKLDASILCQATTNYVTSDQSLYEAIGAFPDKSKIELNKLVKFLEVVEVVSYEQTFRQKKKVLTPERAESLMKDVEPKDDNTKKKNDLKNDDNKSKNKKVE